MKFISPPSTTPPGILITGANTGLGLATVHALCHSPHAYNIILSARTLEKATAAITTVQAAHPTTASTLSH
ncbi:hypothetical protein MMC17_005884 [Xylographa soralifera]|nr:hypothetical protein [Xylographa soralifera]